MAGQQRRILDAGVVRRWFASRLPAPISILERKIEVKNIDRIRSMDESEMVEFLHEASFDCAERCPDFSCGCLSVCTHDAGRDIIREWLETESAT